MDTFDTGSFFARVDPALTKKRLNRLAISCPFSNSAEEFQALQLIVVTAFGIVQVGPTFGNRLF